ncbi:MAG: hypothetical protein ACOCY0_03505 [Roseicyclus sp.]
MARESDKRTIDPRTDAPGPHDPSAERPHGDAPRVRRVGERDDQVDPLAGRTDRPDPVPEADFRNITPSDRRREGMLGGILIFAIPLAILVVGFFMWSSNVGTEGPAVDSPDVVADDQQVEPEDTE